MRAPQRRIDAPVARQLLTQPHRFPFFPAMRILEQLFHRQGIKPEEVLPRRLRFRNTLSLGFPASELEAITAYSPEGERLDGDALVQAIEQGVLGEIHLTPAFM